MSSLARVVLAMLVVTVVAAAAGGWFGVHYGLQEAHANDILDEFLHHRLRLSADQQQRLAGMEVRFAARRSALESEMRSANRDLASAVVSEHRYGPSAERAIEHFHSAMQTLQTVTIQHVLDMRSVLTPEQAQRFDQLVAKALDLVQP